MLIIILTLVASVLSALITFLATQDLFKKVKSDGTPKKKIGGKENYFS